MLESNIINLLLRIYLTPLVTLQIQINTTTYTQQIMMYYYSLR